MVLESALNLTTTTIPNSAITIQLIVNYSHKMTKSPQPKTPPIFAMMRLISRVIDAASSCSLGNDFSTGKGPVG